MVDFDCKTNMVQSTPNLPNMSPKTTIKRNMMQTPSSPAPVFAGDLSPASDSACSAYENYLRLPELRQLWTSREFREWDNEPVIKPALQALEITFRLISTVISDVRPYVNRREWNRRLESLARDQVELISVLCEEDETRGAAPTVDLSSSSESSLLRNLATWQESADLSTRILYY